MEVHVKHFIKWNKPDTKGYLYEVPRIVKFIEKVSIIE